MKLPLRDNQKRFRRELKKNEASNKRLMRKARRKK